MSISLSTENCAYRFTSILNNKQLLNEVEHDIVNSQDRGLCYLPKP